MENKKMFFNKKGIGNQVDWVIGMGIFIIYLSLTFIFFKPGIKPVFDNDTLQDIIKENFDNDATWIIKKTPIFVEQAKFRITMGGSTVEISPNDNVLRYILLKDLDEHIEFSKSGKKTELFFIPTEQEIGLMEKPKSGTRKEAIEKRGIESDRKSDEKEREEALETALKRGQKDKKAKVDNKLVKQLSRDYSVGMGIKNGEVEFFTYFPRAQSLNSFVFLTSEDNVNAAGGFSKYDIEDYNDKLKNLDACIVDETNVLPGDIMEGSKCRAKYKVGVTEEIKGINIKKLLDLNNVEDRKICGKGVRGYDCVRKLWGYPESKDFKIELYMGDKIAEFPKNFEPPADANVYTRNFNDFILSDDGIKVAATVNFMVW